MKKKRFVIKQSKAGNRAAKAGVLIVSPIKKRGEFQIAINSDISDKQLQAIRERQIESEKTTRRIQENYDMLSKSMMNSRAKIYGNSSQ